MYIYTHIPDTYIHAHVYIYAHTYTHINILRYVLTLTHTHRHIYMCMCIYTHMFIFTHTYIYKISSVYVYMHIHLCLTHTNTDTYIHAYTYIHTQTYLHMLINVCTCMYTCADIHSCLLTHTQTCMCSHTHIHTFLPTANTPFSTLLVVLPFPKIPTPTLLSSFSTSLLSPTGRHCHRNASPTPVPIERPVLHPSFGVIIKDAPFLSQKHPQLGNKFDVILPEGVTRRWLEWETGMKAAVLSVGDSTVTQHLFLCPNDAKISIPGSCFWLRKWQERLHLTVQQSARHWEAGSWPPQCACPCACCCKGRNGSAPTPLPEPQVPTASFEKSFLIQVWWQKENHMAPCGPVH